MDRCKLSADLLGIEASLTEEIAIYRLLTQLSTSSRHEVLVFLYIPTMALLPHCGKKGWLS